MKTDKKKSILFQKAKRKAKEKQKRGIIQWTLKLKSGYRNLMIDTRLFELCPAGDNPVLKVVPTADRRGVLAEKLSCLCCIEKEYTKIQKE